MAQEALGDNAAAVASYEKAISLNQGAQRQVRLGSHKPERLLQPHRRAEKGLEYAQQAIALDPQI